MVVNLKWWVDDKIAGQTRETNKRFRNIDDFEPSINAIDQDYKCEDAIFNGYIYKINTPQFNLVNRSQYGNVCDFKYDFIENWGNNCFLPTKGYCSVKCINFIRSEDYKEKNRDLIRIEKKRSIFMTMARIQPCLWELSMDLGYYNNKEIWPRNITERKKALYLHNNHLV